MLSGMSQGLGLGLDQGLGLGLGNCIFCRRYSCQGSCLQGMGAAQNMQQNMQQFINHAKTIPDLEINYSKTTCRYPIRNKKLLLIRK